MNPFREIAHPVVYDDDLPDWDEISGYKEMSERSRIAWNRLITTPEKDERELAIYLDDEIPF